MRSRHLPRAPAAQYPTSGEVELTVESDKGSFTVPRVRDEAVSMIRMLLRLMVIAHQVVVVGVWATVSSEALSLS